MYVAFILSVNINLHVSDFLFGGEDVRFCVKMQNFKLLTFLVLVQVIPQVVPKNVEIGGLSLQEGKNIIETLMHSSSSYQILESVISVLGASGEAGALYSSILKTLFNPLTYDVLKNIQSFSINFDILSNLTKDINLTDLLSFLSSVAEAADTFIKLDDYKGDHSGHEWLLPPIVEKLHVLYEIIIHSPLAQKIVLNVKESKIYKTFADENGNLSLQKFGELMENHSFRKHWIQTVASKIAYVIVRILDPNLRTVLFVYVQNQINNVLKEEGFPKSVLLNVNEPVESASAFINYVAKRFIGYNVQPKKFMTTVFDAVKNVYTTLFGQYINSPLNAEEMSNVITNILNLEIIEPVVKSYRAYRFAKKHKECDKYVMCLVNSQDPNERVVWPIIKSALTKMSSLVSSWFISKHTDTSYFTFILTIIENLSCNRLYHDSCQGFHAEEVRVKREYNHSEL